MASIYRKYRPKTFAEMVGQNHIKLTIMSEIAQDNFTHAYLFCGPRGLGKTTVARLLAKAVNCEKRKSGQAEPCNECQSCLDIMAGKAMDLLEIDAASHTGVDNVRENIIDNVRFFPHRSKFKVFIIDEVHMLSISAFNALLKTLEEPPAHAIFILCMTVLHKVPETIVSRCQHFDFKKVAPAEAIKRLKMIAKAEAVKIDNEVLEIIALRAEGSMRDGENFLGQVLSLGEKTITLEQATLVLPSAEIGLVVEFLKIIFNKKTVAALEFANKLVDDGVDLEIFNKELIVFLRKMILIKEGAVKGDWLGWLVKLGGELDAILEKTTAAEIVDYLKIFLGIERDLKDSEIPQLPMELAIINICEKGKTVGHLPTVEQPTVFKNPAIFKKEPEPKSEPMASVEKEKKEEVIRITSGKPDANLDKIKKNWNQIIKAGHQKSRDLMFVNESMVWPLGIADGFLELGFKYDLHKSRFEINSDKDIFTQAVKETVGMALAIRAKTLKPSELAALEMEKEAFDNSQEKMTGIKVTDDNILEKVLESFGGEVVE